ncbi:TPA: helix-turn-helix transcriptional regulator [Pseudomonas aeruginosa]|uniref:C repressor n=1 Tax=Pseudomonas phage JBD69 TaxID=1777053 RepID=A0A125RN88_9CAUD|nr:MULTISPECIES: helix-turn-helix transcriptional regulator [Pseudomonas]YP_009273626.1 transcriptional repressor [Pseudomonas phage JBD69]AMD42550.1 c repressor [Pseudomonas phage JBD69]ARU34128.1 XRE family transcriptional regulator [Pseudomonas aeruginosa]EIU3856969.1 helix-turn-helix transcriptional regulator [Pseudomonas aeruginosa]EJA3276820.1 helix-turn-helix transcriptional regulator [Pseudomonas aeruginosa]EJC0103466.1 helix-turn-helix transcriptional regulator [Pseudomonas aeruginos
MKSDTYGKTEQDQSDKAAVPTFTQEVGTRIAEVARLLGSRRALAKQVGIHETQLYRYIKGINAAAPELLSAIAKAGRVSLDWLINGEEVASTPAEGAKSIEGEYVYIPLYDGQVSAGHGSWTDGATVLVNLAFTRYSLRKKGLDPSSISAIRIGGDSMEPLLCDGDTVLVDHTKSTVQDAAVYVVRLDDHLYAKRLQRRFDGSVSIISENKAYTEMIVPKAKLSDLEIIGRVVWASRWMV